MKTVFNSQQVAHVWAAQTQDAGRNPQGNFYFDGPVIFSYGSHWPLATFSPWTDASGARLVFTNGGSYGPTTARHASRMRDGLDGLNVRIVDVPTGDIIRSSRRGSALGIDTARDLARGHLDALRDVIATLHAAGVAAFQDSLTRRSDDRIAWSLDTAADYFDTARDLAALPGLAAADRKRLTLAAGERPAAMPAAWRVTGDYENRNYYHPPLDGLRATMKEARAEHARAVARGKMPDAAQRLHLAWLDTNAPRTGEYGAAFRHRQAVRAQEARIELDKLARASGAAVSRNLPTSERIARMVRGLVPLVAIETAERDTQRLRDSTALAVRCYFDARHRARGDAQARNAADTLLGTLQNGGRYAYASLIAPQALIASCGRIAARDQSAETLRDITAACAMPGRIGANARAALHRLDDAAADAVATLTPIAAYVEKRRARFTAETYTGQCRVAVLAAADPDASEATLQRAVNAHAELAKAYAAARLAGVPFADLPGPYDAAVSHIVARIETAKARDLVRRSRASADLVTVKALQAADDASRGFMFSAQRSAQDASRALDAARKCARDALDLIATDGGALETVRVDAEHAVHVAESVAHHVGEAMQQAAACRADLVNATGLIESAAAPLLAVIAWRAGDPFAPTPSGETVFRLRADGVTVESSRGAQVTLKDARRLWALIRAAVAAGRSAAWAYGSGPRVGPFHLAHIGADGSAVVGCHTITAGEARTFARAMGFPPFGDTVTADDALPAAPTGNASAAA
jgi:hypothetical protein